MPSPRTLRSSSCGNPFNQQSSIHRTGDEQVGGDPPSPQILLSSSKDGTFSFFQPQFGALKLGKMVMEFSTPKGKRRTGASSDDNVGPAWKSPLKLLSPIVDTKTIYLHDWWLVRPQGGEGIAVGGFTIRREGVETSFCSTSIKNRHDNSTLDSSDGFIIFISGFINRSITQQNGFSSEVCTHFLNGFPCNWDDFASQCVREEPTDAGSHSRSSDGGHTFLSGSFQDMPFLQKRDLLVSAHGLHEEDALREHISSVLLEKLKPALSSLTTENNDGDLPVADKSREREENGRCKCPSLNLNRVRTRSMTKMENAANRAKLDKVVNDVQGRVNERTTRVSLSNRRKANVTFKESNGKPNVLSDGSDDLPDRRKCQKKQKASLQSDASMKKGADNDASSSLKTGIKPCKRKNGGSRRRPWRELSV